MLIRLILLFTVIPLIELYLLIQVGRYLGSFQTIMIVLITGIIGGLLARSQGLSVQRQIRVDLQKGIIPTDSLIDGCFILIAGALLITPGMITDIWICSNGSIFQRLAEKVGKGDFETEV